jgi:uncharacterized cupredoxin-like copper-binding protein
MMKRVMMILGPLVLLLLAAAGAASASGDETEPPAEPARRVTVTLSEYQFAPSRIELKAGELVELTLINEGTVTHEFVALALAELEVAVTIAGVETETVGVVELEMAPQSRAQLRFTPDKPGEYSFACHATVPVDHATKGMTGVLIVK